MTKKQEVKIEEQEKTSNEKKSEVSGIRWYVVHTYSGHEDKVAATLKQKVKASNFEDRIVEIMVPTQEKIEVREGKKVTLQEKIFPGYILVKMLLNDETWHLVRSTPGVTSFVGIGNKPTPLDEKEVTTIQKFSELEAPTYKASFSIDEAVRIVDGPFADFLGTVDKIDEEKGKVRVLVSIFGRETPVELDFLQVAKI
jgi:transcriptional antiterminator NusG